MIENYYAQRDARESLRESERFFQHEPDDFDSEIPRVTFKKWLRDYWRQLGIQYAD